MRTMLYWKWSPRQIAATLKCASPDHPERYVAHGAISLLRWRGCPCSNAQDQRLP